MIALLAIVLQATAPTTTQSGAQPIVPTATRIAPIASKPAASKPAQSNTGPINTAQPSPAATVALPPQDWSILPPLRMRKPTTALANTSAFVRGEVVAGRCARAVRTTQGWILTVDLAVLIAADGRVRRVTPRAIDCPTVEQYAAGIILGSARRTIDIGDADGETWYRTSLTFAWGG